MKHIERHHKGINIALRGIALMLVAVMCISLCPTPEVQAASASIKVTNVSSTHTLKIGEKKTLKVKTTGVSKKKQKKIKYKTSNKKIVTVSSKGKLTAKKKGSATITVYIPKTKVKTTVKVKVGTKVSKLTRKSFPEKKTLYVGKKYQSVITVGPSKATTKKLKWTSSNSKVAKVNSKGVITAVNNGSSSSKATITATTTDGTNKKLSCVVTVKRYVEKVEMTSFVKAAPVAGGDLDYNKSTNSYEMIVGDSAKISVLCTPENATSKSLVYGGTNVCLNENVPKSGDVIRVCTKDCKYGSKGTVIGLKNGQVALHIEAKDKGGAAFSTNITVYNSVVNTGTKVIAHRGISNNYYENTIGAFKAAAREPQIFGVETDIYDTVAPNTTIEEVEVPAFTPSDIEEMIQEGIIVFPGPGDEEEANYGVIQKDEKVLYTLFMGQDMTKMPRDEFDNASDRDKAEAIWEHSLKDVDIYKASGEGLTEQKYVGCMMELENQWKAAVEDRGGEWNDAGIVTQNVEVPYITMETDLMVMHDSKIEKYCGVKNVSIKSITRYNRQNYPIITTINGNVADAESKLIPTLDEYLESCGTKMPVIEIKDGSLSSDAMNRMFNTMNQKGVKKAIIISFSEGVVSTLAMFQPSAEMLYGVSYEVMYLIKKKDDVAAKDNVAAAIEFCDNNGVDTISMDSTLCKASTVEQIHDAGYKVGIWYGAYSKYDSRLNAAKFASYGVDYVTTGMHPKDLR